MQELSVIDLNKRLQDGEKLQLLDVREPIEVSQGILPGALHIPLAELPARYAELSATLPTIVYCHHGARSAKAVQFLSTVGFNNIANLEGGTDSWSRQIDSSLPIY